MLFDYLVVVWPSVWSAMFAVDKPCHVSFSCSRASDTQPKLCVDDERAHLDARHAQAHHEAATVAALPIVDRTESQTRARLPKRTRLGRCRDCGEPGPSRRRMLALPLMTIEIHPEVCIMFAFVVSRCVHGETRTGSVRAGVVRLGRQRSTELGRRSVFTVFSMFHLEVMLRIMFSSQLPYSIAACKPPTRPSWDHCGCRRARASVRREWKNSCRASSPTPRSS